mmetsp:Transcript_22135/g.35649  ORF Transcript_22135/g.35649 Transcript_22135/m.35649 type:complete len:579 (+) Transcript_22135:77-1813(+)
MSTSILNAMASPDARKKKSYLSSRTREKGKAIRADSVKDSLSKFLDEAEDEDLLFNQMGSNHNKHKSGRMGSSLHHTSGDRISESTETAPLNDGGLRDMPFDRKTSVRKSPSALRPKLKRNNSKNKSLSKKRNDDDDEAEGEDDLQSFAVADEDECDISGSSAEEDNSRRSIRSNHSVRSSRGAPMRTRSMNSRISSSSSSARPSAPRRSQSMRSTGPRRSAPRRNNSIGPLTSGLGDLDRQSRRSSRRGHFDDDGGESVASGTSLFSTSGRSISSRRHSGLEGGALNAILGDEDAARKSSRGLGFSGGPAAAGPADEKFLKERKERLDLIMDVALKEKWENEARAAAEQEELERQASRSLDSDESSDEDEDGVRVKKKKGMVRNLKRAVRKSAKLTKSGAKGTVNVVKDPKRAAKKVGSAMKDVGKETTKMVLDPTLAAKRTAKGVKGTVKLTTKVTGTVAKGSYGVTKSIAKTGFKGTTMVVGSTIDGAGKVVHGATGLIFKKEGENGAIVYEEYDPSLLAHRQKRNTLLDRFADEDHHDKKSEEIEKLQDAGIPMRTPDILAPSINLGGGGSWDV